MGTITLTEHWPANSPRPFREFDPLRAPRDRAWVWVTISEVASMAAAGTPSAVKSGGDHSSRKALASAGNSIEVVVSIRGGAGAATQGFSQGINGSISLITRVQASVILNQKAKRLLVLARGVGARAQGRHFFIA